MGDLPVTRSAASERVSNYQRGAVLVARSLLALSIIIVLVAFVPAWKYVVLTGNIQRFLSHQLLSPLSALVYSLLGALVATKRPHNAIGWIFLTVGLLYGLTGLVTGYDLYGAARWGSAAYTAAGLTSWLGSWLWIPAIYLPTTFVFLLFPDGRLSSPRWRPVAWAAGLGLAALIIGLSLHPDPSQLFSDGVRSPFALTAGEPLWDSLIFLAMILIFVGLIGSIAAPIIRFRRSQGSEREQMKWLAYSASLMIVVILAGGLLAALWPEDALAREINIILTNVAVLGIAITSSIAILRYRLYDINLLINRTLVYGTLTGIVLGLYLLALGGVGLLLQTNRPAVSVLLTAGLAIILYRPLRNGLQSRVNQFTGDPLRFAAALAGSSSSSLGLEMGTPAEETGQTKRPGSWMRLFRLAWIPAAILSLSVLLASVPLMVSFPPLGIFDGRLILERTPVANFLQGALILVVTLSAVVSLALSTLLYFKKPADRMSLYLAYFLLANGILMAGPIEALQPYWAGAAWVNSFVLLPLFAGPMTMALIGTFPDGRFVPSWSRWLIVLSFIIVPAAPWIGQAISRIDFTGAATLILAAAIMLSLALMGAALYVQVYRYRHVSTRAQRQQTKWVLYGLFLWLIAQLVTSGPWLVALGLPEGAPLPWWSLPVTLLFISSSLILPITLSIAVLRYRLFEIDLIINRTLVFGALTLIVLLLYGLVVGAIGAIFQAQGDWIVALVATGLVAALFQPLRQRLQLGVNRLLYGQRDEPFEVLASLGHQLEGVIAPEMVFPTVVRTVAQTLKLPYVAIAIGDEEGLITVESYGRPIPDPIPYPLTHQGQLIGQLLVSKRTPGDDFTEADERLLRNIARQAGTAVHSVHLTDDLQRSRQRLVSAREEERRRLRRDLHDGLGPTLAALNLQAAVLRRTIDDDPQSAQLLVDEFRSDIRAAIAGIRQVVYELRPPALDDLGLVAAIRAQAGSYSRGITGDDAQPADMGPPLSVTVIAPDTLPDLPAAAEVALYRIAQEALANVAHHARARRCFVYLRIGTSIEIEIVDDGRGLGDYTPGVGLRSMRERAEELGGAFSAGPGGLGGARIWASIPVAQG